MDKIICVFGASTTWGIGDKEKGGWVNRLRKYVESNEVNDNYISVYNLGVDGDDTNDLLERFEFETKQRIKKGWYDEIIIIFSIGANDSMYVKSKDSPQVSLEKFENNLNKLIKQAKKFTKKVIFNGGLRVNESKTTQVPWNNGLYYTNKSIQKYNQIIKSVCQKHELLFVDMFNLLDKENLDDGLHPNSQGHQKIFEKVKDFLLENKLVEK